ncbi:hypothetical protein AX774_g6693 [Zancudomyces culisetae]|uniref:DEK-C domain-containing protein n=1 Tax=Zancudomyces culisetae TaxID=1213189 RepID=A0A1R1PG33_ZANCU|nr:hypothetical protein AX774_g6693 [Zancudomyces culisetae]|eukprot:OMH79883.1 hypothetical protein AX774_g6693 [Zancudomyces culisetae]
MLIQNNSSFGNIKSAGHEMVQTRNLDKMTDVFYSDSGGQVRKGINQYKEARQEEKKEDEVYTNNYSIPSNLSMSPSHIVTSYSQYVPSIRVGTSEQNIKYIRSSPRSGILSPSVYGRGVVHQQRNGWMMMENAIDEILRTEDLEKVTKRQIREILWRRYGFDREEMERNRDSEWGG